MRGPYSLEAVGEIVDDFIGVYILSRNGRTASYVGRSDSNLRARILQSASQAEGYRYFWFEYATSPMTAYKMECAYFHDWNPPDNTIHPAVPAGALWRCPVAVCSWS